MEFCEYESRVDPLPHDQPNRAVRTRMLRGVGGGSCETPLYPDRPYFHYAHSSIFDLEKRLLR